MHPPNLIDVLQARAAKNPETIGFGFLENGEISEQLAWGELDGAARRLAGTLQQLVQPGDRALLVYPAGLEFVRAFFGCLYAGVAAAPVPPPDPVRLGRTLPRLLAVAEDASPAVVLTTSEIASSLATWATEAPTLRALRWVATDELADAPAELWRKPAIAPSSLALLQYTSGSTAAPRGVVISHDNIRHNAAYLQHAWGYSPTSVAAMWVPNFHDDGVIHGIVLPVVAGSRCLLMAPLPVVRRPIDWLRAISRYRVTHSGGPNFIYALAARKTTPEERQGLDLSSWSMAYNAAEPIRYPTLLRFHELFAPHGFRWSAFHPAFGLAEATLIVSTKDALEPALCTVDAAALERHALEPPGSAQTRTLVGCGKPILDTRIAIRHPETSAACRADEIGEVWVSSASIAQGYWRHSEATALTFVPDPDGGSGRALRTGDLGFLKEGELFITGRLKDLVILRGRNLYPQDLELSVEHCHPGLRPGCCAAFAVDAAGRESPGRESPGRESPGRESPGRESPGRECLAVAVELDAAVRPPDEDWIREIFAAIRRAVAQEHDVQVSHVVLLKPGTLPKTSSGKIQRQACRKAFLAAQLDAVAEWTDPARKDPVRKDPVRKDPVRKDPVRADALIAWLQGYAETRLNSQLIDERRMIPPYVVLDFGNQGLFGLQIPERWGGLGLRMGDTLRVLEQLAAIDLTLATFVCGSNLLGSRPIVRHGSPELCAELLPDLAAGRRLSAFALTEPGAGSAVRAITSQAVPHGPHRFKLWGEKIFSGSAAWSSVINVFVQLIDDSGRPAGVAAFAVPQGKAGLKIGPEALTMGLRGMVQNSLQLAGVEVGERELLGELGAGMDVAKDAMLFTRLGIAAMSLGSMKRCAQLMHRYASRRQVATGRLLDNPVTLERFGQLLNGVAVLEALVTAVAALVDGGEEEVPEEAFIVCKTAGPELLWQAADGLVQLLGGRGYSETNEASRLLRDARIFRIFEGPTEPLLLHLGSRVMHKGAVIAALLTQLGAGDLAQPLQRAATRVHAHTLELESTFADRTAAIRWAYGQIGGVATWAVLTAAVRRAAERTPSAALTRAAEWARAEMEARYQRALNPEQKTTLLTSSAVDQEVRALTAAIGDVEQQLEGLDHQLDPLLRRAQDSGEAPAQERESRSWSVPAEATLEAAALVVEHFPESPRAGRTGALLVPAAAGADSKAAASTAARMPAARTPAARTPAARTPAPAVKHRAEEEIQDWLCGWLERVLQVAGDQLEPHRPFAELGMDSVFAAELAEDLSAWLGRVLPATILWSFSTVETLSRHLASAPVPSAAGQLGERKAVGLGGWR